MLKSRTLREAQHHESHYSNADLNEEIDAAIKLAKRIREINAKMAQQEPELSDPSTAHPTVLAGP